MVSDLERVRLLLAEVLKITSMQMVHFSGNRVVEMLKCQQERTEIFNELVELSIEKYIEDPRVRVLIEDVLKHDKELALNLETTIEEHKQKVVSIQKGTVALRAYSR